MLGSYIADAGLIGRFLSASEVPKDLQNPEKPYFISALYCSMLPFFTERHLPLEVLEEGGIGDIFLPFQMDS